ncbi:MAG: hypothetical protein Unbinned1606contig1000_48 [Prokaryotic dsDNA virus sp.]|nr:MAG: hypothetical protein Unbinned1606contig1000_48 [Prokaryotic dsDNA virus sp.]|tara:strand:+ start:364 stop:624 length:261 start_codon:yes stop_codon:yes gene_type:complete
MPDIPASTLQVREFPGLVAEINTFNLPSGASDDQVNIVPDDIGRLKSRNGYAVVSFSDDYTELVGFFYIAYEGGLLVDHDGNYVVG